MGWPSTTQRFPSFSNLRLLNTPTLRKNRERLSHGEMDDLRRQAVLKAVSEDPRGLQRSFLRAGEVSFFNVMLICRGFSTIFKLIKYLSMFLVFISNMVNLNNSSLILPT